MKELQYFTKSIANKLKLLEDVLGLSPSEMANICGCSKASYYRYRSGKSIPGWDFLTEIISYDNRISANWLLKDTGPVLNMNDSEDINTESSINLPFYEMNEDHSTGEGSLSFSEWQESSEEMPICLDIFKFIEIESFDHLFVIRVECDAMYPDIKPNSIAVVDRLQNNINLDGIYLIKMANAIRLKLVQRVPNDKVQLSTVNDKYKSILIPLDDLSDSIIGKIVWVGTPYN